MICLSSVIYTCKHSVSSYFKRHLILCIRYKITIFISNIYCNIRQILSVCCNRLSVSFCFQFCCRSCCFNRCTTYEILCDLLAVFIKCFGSDRTVFIRNHPFQIQILMSISALIRTIIYLICISCVRVYSIKCFSLADLLFISGSICKPQLYTFSITVYNNRNLISALFIYNFFIPSRKNMKCIHIVIPLTLIEVIVIFRKSCCINDTEIRVFRRWPLSSGHSCTYIIPRRRFSDVIKACPHIFSCNKVTLDYFIPRTACRSAPTYC